MALQTPFETDGTSTTYAEEIAFYDALAADSGRISRWALGTGSTGATLYLLAVSPTPPATPVPTDSVLIIAQQHGDEVASRETVIEMIRDLAYTTDPAEVAYLTDHPVYFIPTMNYRNNRNNQNNVNINRDHIVLSQPETRLLHQVICDIDPNMVIDVHEFNGQTTPNAELMYALFDPLNDSITARSGDLVDFVSAHLTSVGITWDYYTVTGDDPSTARNALAARNIVTMLVETMGGVPLGNRITYGLATMVATLTYHRTNHAAIVADVAAARAATLHQDRATPYEFGDGVSVSPVPKGYYLTAAQHDAWSTVLNLLQITATPDGTGYYVSMEQDQQALIPLLMDPSSVYKGFTAVRDNPPLAPPVSSYRYYVRSVAGTRVEALSLKLRSNGVTTTIWTPVP